MLRAVLYFLTPFIALYFRQKEKILTAFLFAIMIAVMYNRTSEVIIFSIILGTLMVLLEHICIQNGMWKYFNTNSPTIPYWLIFLWITTILFIHDVFRVYGKV